MLGWICVVYPAEKDTGCGSETCLYHSLDLSTQQIGLKYGNSEILVLLFGF